MQLDLAYFQSIVDTLREPVVVLSQELKVVSANRAFYRVFKGTAEDTVDHPIYEIGDGQWNNDALRSLLEDIVPNNSVFDDFEIVQAFPNLGKRHILLNARKIYRPGNNTDTLLLAFEDVTAKRQAEAIAATYLQELETLNNRLSRAMQETHHRVKNNLQVISAMSELEAMRIQETATIAALQRISQHVQALAIIHDLLTQQSKDLGLATDQISVAAVLNRLVPLLTRTLAGRILNATTEDFILTVREGASVALLINELVSNAVKHGKGAIDLTLRPQNGHAILSVCDDGEGFPEGFDPVQAANTGLDLIQSVAEWDLRGTIEYSNRPQGGACVTVTFPVAGRATS